MDSVRLYWAFVRPFTLLPPMIGVLCGSLIATAATHKPLPILHLILAVVAVAALNGASNGLNQIYDLASDRINKPFRPLPSGSLMQMQAWIFVVSAYLVALATVAAVGRQAFVLYAIAAVGTLAYSAPPMRLKKRLFTSNFVIALIRGELLIAAGWSVVSSVLGSIEPWYIGFVLFVFLTGATTTKDFGDVEGDRASGCVTLPVRYGVEWSARAISPTFVVPWLLLPLGVSLKVLSANAAAIFALSLVMVAWGSYVVYRMNRTADSLVSESENHLSWRHMYWMMMAGDVGLAVAYLMS